MEPSSNDAVEEDVDVGPAEPIRTAPRIPAALWLLLVTCAHGSPAPTARQDERSAESSPPLVAQGCSPGMSCFGHVIILPSGEVAEATAAAAAATAAAATAATAATAAAVVQTQKDATPKTQRKSAQKEKTEVKNRLKRKVTCELRGGNVKQPNRKIRCSYYCPGDPPGVVHEILLDMPECPQPWDFGL